MNEFTLDLNTKIYFGTHILEKALINEKERFENKNVMIVTTGGSLIKYGYLKQLEELIKYNTDVKNISIYDKISQNPKLYEVQKASKIGRDNNVQLVIGFGGGSAIDAAKAVSAGIVVEDGMLEKFLLEGIEPPEKTLPIIAIPTTAGTGSELSKAAIISSPEHNIKSGIRGKSLIPKVAIVDAAFTWTVPEKTTTETGFDVLAHAVESYVAVKSNIYSEMLSERSIKIVGKCLRNLRHNLESHNDREYMSFASTIMGMNLANVGTALPHRMQYPIGAMTDTSHAAGLAAIYPSWISHEYEENALKVSKVFEWLGCGNVQSPQQAREVMKQFQIELGIEYTLETLGIKENKLDELTNKITGNLANDRIYAKPDIVMTIYRESL